MTGARRALPLRALRPGQRFQTLLSGRMGELLRVSPVGAHVRWEGTQDRSFVTRQGTAVGFARREYEVTISAETSVEPR